MRSVRGIFEFDQPVNSVSRVIFSWLIQVEKGTINHRKIHSTKTRCTICTMNQTTLCITSSSKGGGPRRG